MNELEMIKRWYQELEQERDDLLIAYEALAVSVHMESESHRAFRGEDYSSFSECQHPVCIQARHLLARYVGGESHVP